MDLIDRLREISARIPKQIEHLQTEEATKNALIMPFISALGYDVFNPTEVVPEFIADVGTKKGEKVDYAILQDGKPIILFECKTATVELGKEHASQLYRYFSVTDARFGVLTNGVEYMIFTDLEEPNKMDARPFLDFTMADISEQTVGEVKKFAKETFDVDNILSTASELKYTKGMKRVLAEEWVNPSEDFVKLIAGRVFSGRMTQTVREQFTDLTRKAFRGFVNDKINERLQSALDSGASAQSIDDVDTVPAEVNEDSITTTDEEVEAFYVVRAILREIVPPGRVFMRDRQSYCGVLLDDNNRKPICRLHFNGRQKYLGIFDNEKNETRHAIADLGDIYDHAVALKATVQGYG